jgi:hypothetical protein
LAKRGHNGVLGNFKPVIQPAFVKNNAVTDDKHTRNHYFDSINMNTMNKLILLFLAILPPSLGFCQYEFNNKGANIYVQTGALIEVQGNFVNDNGSSNGAVKNDGIIEVQGNFQNNTNATFGVSSDNTSKDRAVKFVGSGTQEIIGNMNTPGTSSFYNVVVDKTTGTDAVEMHSDISVEGSLVFGAGVNTTTYNPSLAGTTHNGKGFVKTYTDSSEFNLNITNGNTDAIAGYPAMAMNGAPTTAYVLTSGNRGSASGGLQRQIATAQSYDFPIGTIEHGFNAVRMNFVTVPAGGGLVKGKFNDGSDNPSGSVGTITQQCIGCTPQNPTPDNNGYNRYFSTNPCNANAPQWVVLQDAIVNHGYWSFTSATNQRSYSYSVEVFPNGYTMEGNLTDTWRTLFQGGSYGYNPSAAAVDWNSYIDSVSAITDLLEYSLNTGTCYTGSGVPGGIYTGFGHFGLKKSQSDNALPVKLISVNATPAGESIQVSWATALEINNNGFEVQRSTDGVTFTKIAWVAGHDNSTVQENYSYNDVDVQANTVYYYRLNQIDNNGNSTLSYTVSAEVTGGASVSISELMPNPASASTRFVMSTTASQDITVKMYNMVGQLVSNQPFSLNAGDNTINLNVQSLTSGSYSAIIEAGGKSFSKMLVVSR